VVRAALVQFEPSGVRLVQKGNVDTVETVCRLIQSAAKSRALVFYTLVSKELRAAIQEAARHHMVPVVDLLGPVLVALYDLLKSAPLAKPGILYESDKAHYDRIDAVEYTLAHDDGCRLSELKDADVVLVGVSRCSKSTTCFYLGYLGIRAANVPLFADAEPPLELLKIDPRRVIGLTANPYRLRSVRQARMRSWGANVDERYTHPAQISHELRAARAQMTKYGWRCIDVSYKAIEEIAREVLQLLRDSGLSVGAAGGRRPET